MKAKLAFLWHMHQPYYRDMRTGHSSMPWVRLHGIHSYYDMVMLHEQHPEIHTTINFVPSLIRQLQEYAVEEKGDEFLQMTMLPADNLNESQREFILRHFFSASQHRMIAPHARYRSLYERLGTDPKTSDLTEAIRFFSPQDYRDIQIYYNLIWFGFTALQEIPEIKQMLESGGRFSEGDKQVVFKAQITILNRLLKAISRAAKSKNVEISTTPFYHPILPLLIDSRIAKRPQPKMEPPPQFKEPKHAIYQIQRSVQFMERDCGIRPSGMWPAEGGVCPEMLPMLHDAGIKWIATDEGILERSGIKNTGDNQLHPYIAEHRGKDISILFRNRELSDRISFVYSGMEADDAVADFVEKFYAIASRGHKGKYAVVPVILDGENPWEHYENGGKDFLTTLFNRLISEGIQTATIRDYLAEHKPTRRIEKLASGSWINSNFAIWSGKPQKNMAWNYIKQTSEDLGNSITPREDMTGEECMALESFSAACGSDWFWWYDDDFASSFKVEFDKIFRTHLINSYNFLGREAPQFLLAPIYHLEERREAFVEPPAFIHPSINGSSDSFFEWANAARIDIHRFGGAMGSGDEVIDAIYFGFDREAFYLRFDPHDHKRCISLSEGESIAVSVIGNGIDLKMKFVGSEGSIKLSTSSKPEQPEMTDRPDFALGDILEFRCPFSCLPHKEGDRFTLVIALHRGGVERIRYADIRFAVPDENYEYRMWTV